MKSKDIKITIFIYNLYECAAVEEYLELMAQKGWLLQSIIGILFKFKKIEPQKIRYSVDVLNKLSSLDGVDTEVALEYREYCQAAGWKYVCQRGKIQVFYTASNKDVTSIHTDEIEKFKLVFKSSLNDVIGKFFFVLLLTFILYGQLYRGDASSTLASNIIISQMVIELSLILIIIIQVFSFFLWGIKARSHLKENKCVTYNSYKQLRIKHISFNTYFLICIIILLGFTIFYKHESKGFTISLLLIICIPIIILIYIQKLINKKRYSKNTNMAIRIASTVASVYLVVILVGVSSISTITKTGKSEVPNEKANLTLMDFGYKEIVEESPNISFNESILAQRISYADSSQGNDLIYIILKSKKPWIIRYHEKRLVSRLNRYGNDLKQERTSLPNNIKVYSDIKKRTFVLVSKDKTVEIIKGFSAVSDDEFLNKVYEKLFN